METYSEKTDLRLLARKLKWRVYGLLAIYGLIIVASLVLFVFVLRYSTLTFLDIMHSGTVDKPEIGVILLLIAITAVLLVCVGTALAPLVNVLAHKTENGIEIKREDYPDFFSLIDNIVKEIGCKSPKHVYIDEECNACGFYDGIWGYCFQRLNLVIGIPLLFGMNKTELKAILSHELGHFSQKSLSTHRIAFISEWLFGEFASMAKKRDDSEITERLFARLSIKIMLRQYSKVDPLMAVLSRAQEYDADKSVYNVVGTDGSISALHKIAELSVRWDTYFMPWLLDRIDEKRIPNDIFRVFSQFSANADKICDESESLISKNHYPSLTRDYDFRVASIDNPETHPTKYNRFQAIKSLPAKKTEWDDTPAFDLFPKQVIEDIYNSVATKLKDQRYPNTTVFLKKEDFNGATIISLQNLFSSSLNIFYIDPIFYEDCALNLDSYTDGEVFDFPFTLENVGRIRAFLVAQIDLRRLRLISKENSPHAQFRYNDEVYNGTNVPLEEHKAYFEPLYEEARRVASHCNKWIHHQVKDRNNLLDMFHSMILCERTEDALENLAIEMNIAKEPVDYVNEVEMRLQSTIELLYQTTSSGTPYIDFIHPSTMASDLSMKDRIWNFTENGCEDKNDLYSISSYVLDLVKKHFSFSWDIIKYEVIFPAIEANNKV